MVVNERYFYCRPEIWRNRIIIIIIIIIIIVVVVVCRDIDVFGAQPVLLKHILWIQLLLLFIIIIS
jgi:hypothetical protein